MNRILTHREFRFRLAEGLLARFPRSLAHEPRSAPTQPLENRLDRIDHFPGYTEMVPGRLTYSRRRCARCAAVGVRSQINTMCTKCNVPLCIGRCFSEYHTVRDLSRRVVH